MSLLAVSAVRQRVAGAIASALGATGWREGTGAWDVFGLGDGEGRFHKGYAVGCPSTAFKAGRQKPSEGALCETAVRVRWAWNLAAMDQVNSYDSALDAERAIIAAVAAQQQSSGLHLTFVTSSRPVDGEGWVIGDMTWTALHRLPLTT